MTAVGSSETSIQPWTDRGWGILLGSIVSFMVIFNVTFAAVPSPSTLGAVIRLGTVALLWFGIAAFRGLWSEQAGPLLLLLALTFYAFLQFALTGFVDSSQAVRMFAFILYAVYGALLLATLFRGESLAFARACAIAGVIQATLILVSFLSPGYRSWLNGVVQQSGNIDIVSGFGAPGFSNSAGALLSVAQAGCVLAALLGARTATGVGARVAFVCAALLIAGSTVFAGRTGLMLSAAFFIVYTLASAAQGDWRMVALLVTGAIALLVIGNAALELMAAQSGADVGFLRTWAFELFQRGDQVASYGDLVSQPVPPLSLRTVIGTGLVSALPPWSGNASGNDSGYVQTYFGLGLAASVLFYSTVTLLAARMIALSRERLLMGILAIAMFAIEAKEPFMFKAPLPIIFFTFAFMRFARTEDNPV